MQVKLGQIGSLSNDAPEASTLSHGCRFVLLSPVYELTTILMALRPTVAEVLQQFVASNPGGQETQKAYDEVTSLAWTLRQTELALRVGISTQLCFLMSFKAWTAGGCWGAHLF